MRSLALSVQAYRNKLQIFRATLVRFEILSVHYFEIPETTKIECGNTKILVAATVACKFSQSCKY